MAATDQTKNTTPSSNDGLSILVLLALFVLAVASLGAVLIYLAGRFEEGTLILSERGCRVLSYHDVLVAPLDTEGLCRIHAQYRFPADTARFGTIRIETSARSMEIELPGREVVSKARD
mgnify:CR=1 FL=1